MKHSYTQTPRQYSECCFWYGGDAFTRDTSMRNPFRGSVKAFWRCLVGASAVVVVFAAIGVLMGLRG